MPRACELVENIGGSTVGHNIRRARQGERATTSLRTTAIVEGCRPGNFWNFRCKIWPWLGYGDGDGEVWRHSSSTNHFL